MRYMFYHKPHYRITRKETCKRHHYVCHGDNPQPPPVSRRQFRGYCKGCAHRHEWLKLYYPVDSHSLGSVVMNHRDRVDGIERHHTHHHPQQLVAPPVSVDKTVEHGTPGEHQCSKLVDRRQPLHRRDDQREDRYQRQYADSVSPDHPIKAISSPQALSPERLSPIPRLPLSISPIA